MAVVVSGAFAADVARAAATDAQVWRCERQGRISFQQQPCGDGERSIDATPTAPANVGDAPPPGPPPSPSRAEGGLPARPGASPAMSPAAAATAGPTALTGAPTGPFAQDAERCLDYLRPFLRDPRSAYVSAPRREGRVLHLTLHVANTVGGIVTKPAACEFVNGVVDRGWSRIQLERLGWFQGPVYVEPRAGPLLGRRLVQDDVEMPDAAERSRLP